VLAGVERAQEPHKLAPQAALLLTQTKLSATDFLLESAQEAQQNKAPIDAPKPKSDSLATIKHNPNNNEGKQPKRILWIIPNYRAVSANTQLPPLSAKGKFWLATQDSFDYSSFALAGIVAGIGQVRKGTPEFRENVYTQYFWHSFADQAIGNYFTEALVPIATRQDPRYYTLGHGGFFRRSGYALSRLLITRTDSGGRNFNFSEIVGNGSGAGLSDLYYPRQERTWTKTGQKWLLQVGIDGVFNIAKEFWPDIDRVVFHGHYGNRRDH
jgi:hypothetical protein